MTFSDGLVFRSAYVDGEPKRVACWSNFDNPRVTVFRRLRPCTPRPFDAVFEWFDRAVEERDQIMMPILSYAHFDPLRNDPRFAAVLRKMKLG